MVSGVSGGTQSDQSGTGGSSPGWYPDPAGRFETRFHNGHAWTADVSTNGDRYVDPLGVGTPQPPDSQPNRLATAAMVLGIISLAVGWMPFLFVVGAIAALLALVFGTVGLRHSRASDSGRSYAVTGLVTGGVGLITCVVGLLLSIVVIDALDRYNHPNPNEAVISTCDLSGSTATLIGELTNLGDDTADFSIDTAFLRPGTNNAHRSARIAVNNVAAGTSAEFEVTRDVSLAEIECIIRDVDGPLPFGLEIE